MKLQRRKLLLIFLFVVILVFIPIFWLILSLPYGEGQPSPISFTRAYIETQNHIVEAQIHQTQTATAEGFGYGIPEGRTMTPIPQTVTPTQP